jgi:sialic acid synthase SpsE
MMGSGEITNFPLLAYMARTGNPVLLSTGMSELADVREAVAHLRSEGCTSLALFHCVSNYPTKPD